MRPPTILIIGKKDQLRHRVELLLGDLRSAIVTIEANNRLIIPLDAANAENDLAILTDDLTTEIRNNQPKIDIDDDAISHIIGTLSDAIREKLTPDLPGLNPKEENAIIGQLGPSLFIYFLRVHRYHRLRK